MPQSVLLHAAGLYTFPNSLSEIPPGSLTVADNVVIDRNGVIEPRRGFHQYGNTFGSGTDIIKQLMTYKNHLLRHFNSTIQFDDGTGTFQSFSGSFLETQTGLRIKSIEANGNFYFTTSNGIECISASDPSQFTTAANYIRPSGAVQALDINGVVDYSTGGWFIYQTSQPGQSMVAYRMTWAFYDANGDLVESAPSSRLVLTNYSTTDSAVVDLTFQIPSPVTLGSPSTKYFYNIYRTAVIQTSIGVTLANLDPGDEEYLVIQDFPTSAQLSAGVVTVTDSTPESFRKSGTLLYTNPVSGAGILQSNFQPPIAKDINLFQNTTFFANTQTIQQFNLSLLSTLNLTSGTSQIHITQGLTTNTYTFVGTKEIQDFHFDTKANTTDGGYFLINSASNLRKYFVWFNKSGAVEIQTISFDTVANTNSSGYFLLNSADNATKYFVWFDKSGSDTLPSGADTTGRTGIRVSLVGFTTGTQIATAVAQSLPTADFTTSTSTNSVTITNVNVGVTTPITNGITPVDSSGYFATHIVQNQAGADPTPQPSASDTVGRLPILVDLRLAVSAVDVANAVVTAVNNNGADFVAAITVGSTVRITNGDNGPATTAVNGMTPVGGTFSITLIHAGTGENTATQQVLLGNSISTSISIDETARSLVKCINANPASVIYAFYLSGPSDLPGLMLFQAKNLSDPEFTITADSTATGNEFNPALPTSGTSVGSSNLVELNAIYYSKFQQPEAVPTVNKFLVGPKDKAILRILPVRTGLMILKEDGIYRLTGVNGNFNIDPFDNSAILNTPDSAVVLNNQIYMFSTQGVVSLTDTGVNVLSRPIEDQLNLLTTSNFNYKPNTFGVAYESDRAYLLWTVTNPNDTFPTQCFRFNTFTTAWTRWPISKNAGIVRFDQQQLYVAPTDQDFIETERKNFNRTDYADREYPISIPDNAVINLTEIELSSIQNVQPGDALVQVQYLTVFQFNQLLQMLDADSGTAFKQYFNTYQTALGSDLRTSLDNLMIQLNSDSGLMESDFSVNSGSDFLSIQNDFNTVITKLIANVHTRFKNYPMSTGTTTFETFVVSLVQNSNNVIIQYTTPFVVGELLSYRGITTDIVWAPQTFGDPSVTKHVSEGTFMFDNTDFFSATISYASDLSPNFEDVVFNETGIGDWGYFAWDTQTWGGSGLTTPIRTYIPRNKQYCRFLRPSFSHMIAREKFSATGLSLTFRPIAQRGYRS